MALFKNKQKQIESQFRNYCQKVSLCLDEFRDTFRQYCQNSDRSEMQENVKKVHKAESRADDIRREIEVVMYTKALFPESRGDILGLLETMDKVPNKAEAAAQMVLSEHIVIPNFLHANLLQLVDVCHRCVLALIESAEKIFEDFTNATVAIGRIDELESEGDFVEANLIEQIFTSDLEGAEKIMLRDMVQQVAAVSDRAENAGDRIRIIVAKRKI